MSIDNMTEQFAQTAAQSGPGRAVGKPLDRVDGRLKVTGGARYSAEISPSLLPGLAHAVIVTSTIGKGRIVSMDTAAATSAPGVLAVLTPFNAPRLPQNPGSPGSAAPRPQNRVLQVLQDTTVFYNNQPIAVVVAETFEQAVHGAALVKPTYQEQKPNLDLDKGLPHRPAKANQDETDSSRGDIGAGERQATTRVEQTYTTPFENHNPLEPHATTAVWNGDRLTLYDATQGIFGVQNVLSKVWRLPPDNVRVLTYFVGGGFGCKGSVWSHVVLASMAARQTGRPVKLVLSRRQMFGPVGYRPQTRQKLLLGADATGTLTASRHDVLTQTSMFDEFVEASASATRMLYAVPNQETSHRLSRLDVSTPTYMRAPGESTGTFALESAMDELAYALKMDPIALRLKNYALIDQDKNQPFSSKSLKQCYQTAAAQFDWSRRLPEPRAMRAPDGRLLGLGMATATYPTRRSASSALATLRPDGTALVRAGTQDIGTGTYTIMTQIAADALGLTPAQVQFELGDTQFPETPVSGGSQTAASTGSAVQQTCQALKVKAVALAVADAASPLHGLSPDGVNVESGRLVSSADPSRGETYAALLSRQRLPFLSAETKAQPGHEKQEFAMHSFGAVFTEVLVDPDSGEARLSRVVGAYGAGRILNAKTGRSQLLGGIIFGIGMALTEQTVTDGRWGRVVNPNLAEYHIPVNLDVPQIDINFVDEVDPHVNPMGAKGIGEIGITGVVASIGNALYHATGRRVRDLPFTPDKFLA